MQRAILTIMAIIELACAYNTLYKYFEYQLPTYWLIAGLFIAWVSGITLREARHRYR